jgi:acetylornithine deacetylase
VVAPPAQITHNARVLSDIDPIQLARELIAIPSVTEQEHQVADFVSQKLEQLGFSVRRHDVGNGRQNVYAALSERPRVVFCSHLDTVPPFFEPYEDEKNLFGRGSCDAKGIIAAMIAAGQRLLDEGIREFGYLLVVGEETDSIGAKKANEEFAAVGAEYVIVGEPTESTFVRATKGALTCTVRFSGVAAHSAYPERGDSAIRKLARAIEAIYATDWGTDQALGRATANVGVVRGGMKANIIPAEAELEVIVRSVTPISEVRAKLQKLIEPLDGVIIRSHGNDPVYMTVPEGEMSEVVAFNTDAPHLKNFGRPLLFGPGSILDAHSATESISKRELLAAVGTYASVVRRLLKGEPR